MKQIKISESALTALAAKYKSLNAPAKIAYASAPLEKSQFVTIDATDKYGNSITYNEKQQLAIDLALQGKSFVLIGAAGTGKTTVVKGIIRALLAANKIPKIKNHDHAYLPSNNDAYGLIITAFTRRATNNIRKNNEDNVKDNCVTIHKVLEYQPVYYDTLDEKGNAKTSMRFEETRTDSNPLPSSISNIFFEESSMIATDLHKKVMAAAGNSPKQVIYLGDIQQLPPVFGSAVLGFKMLELPVIELTEVYRQALDSPIIKLAHRILSGKEIPVIEFPDWQVPDKLKFTPWKTKIDAEDATRVLASFFVNALSNGTYNPEEDGILIPYNKGCGSIELNNHIANSIAKKNFRTVWQIIYGFNITHLAVGDKCLYDKEDAIVLDIYHNPAYSGKQPVQESVSLNYWGHMDKDSGETLNSQDAYDDVDIDHLLSMVSMADDEDEVSRQASHCVKLRLLDSDREVIITRTGEFNNLILGYAITVHKSQGSEWKKVFLCLHASHNTMISRELLYTAVTRAKESLEIICEKNTFIRGINSQRIKGNTIAEKAEFFKGKVSDVESEE